jgi:hypothetical protein
MSIFGWRAEISSEFVEGRQSTSFGWRVIVRVCDG